VFSYGLKVTIEKFHVIPQFIADFVGSLQTIGATRGSLLTY
jgi:hypothetical protein